MENVQNIKERAQEVIVGLKKYGYVVGILMVALGVLVFLNPAAISAFLVWMLLGGLLVSGISKIVYYFKMPKEMRNGGMLAIGILWLVCVGFILADIFNMPIATTVSIQAVIGLFIGFNCIFSGITSMCMSRSIKEAGGSSGMAIFAGVLEVICGVLVLSSPLMGLITITAAFGICLALTGVATIVRCIAY